MSASGICEITKEILKKKFPEAQIVSLPLSDGGEGSGEIIHKYKYPVIKNIITHDAAMHPLNTIYYTDATREKALIESAVIIGLPLIPTNERNPLKTSSYGLGETINEVIRSGCKEITVTLGGSATCDAGKGMMDAIKEDLNKIKFRVITDVMNPLFGEMGAVRVFAPQKGAKPKDLPLLEENLENYILELKEKGMAKDEDIQREGAGAAGGLGFAFQTLLKAESFKGIEYIFNLTEFSQVIENADLIITGEGKLDKQSFMGKVVGEVIRQADIKNIPVVILTGISELDETDLPRGVRVLEIIDRSLSIEENLTEAQTKANLRRILGNI